MQRNGTGIRLDPRTRIDYVAAAWSVVLTKPAGYLERLEAAFQGEVYGEAMYLAIAESQREPEHAWKWRVLAQQESEIRNALRALLAAHGVDARELEESRKRGVAEARRYAAMPWKELMRHFSDELDVDIDRYAELEKDCPPKDAATLRRLTLHEELTKEFCERELAAPAGDRWGGRSGVADRSGDESIRAILDSLEHPPPRRDAAAGQ